MYGFGDTVGVLRDLFIDLRGLLGECAHLFRDDTETGSCRADPGGFNGCCLLYTSDAADE